MQIDVVEEVDRDAEANERDSPSTVKPKAGDRFEIAHILFIDIVGYSKLMLNQQREILRELNDVVRQTEEFAAAETAGQLQKLPTGDGLALIFRSSPEAPVQCAREIAQSLAAHPQLQLRMGIHSGPVHEVADVNNRANFAGAGINIAQRVMDCGDAGHILLSKHIAEDLQDDERWRDTLYDLGEVTVKHGVTVHVVNFCTNGIGNCELPGRIRLQRDEKVALAKQSRARTRILLLGISLLLAVAAAIYFMHARRSAALAGSGLDAKGIAVLPFDNFSDDKENAFFADGIQDDVLTNLAKIRDLRVISRTSVMKFRKHAHTLREIGEALGVANILEGSVRRARDRVAVNVQLIDARNDHHIWANHYDRTLADSLGIEGELAAEIAEALRATLTPDEKERVERKPTQNADAWVLYLRARQLQLNPDTLLQEMRTAAELYQKAIELDPNFALARASLSLLSAQIFHFHEPLDSWKNLAREQAEAALRLQPNLAEAHLGRGAYLYWIDVNYDAALRELRIAADLAPSDSYVALTIAAVLRRQGKWEESLAAFERAEKLDPQNPNVVRNILFTYDALRNWPKARETAKRFRALSPDSVVAKIQTAYVAFQSKGETGALRKALADIPAGVDPDGIVTSCRWEGAMLERDFNAAAKVLAAYSPNEIDYLNIGSTPKSFLVGLTAVAQNNRTEAERNLSDAALVFEKEVQQQPEVAERHANLGLCYAFMGQRDQAIREGLRAVELKPESKDAYDGVLMNCCLALIYARTGDNDHAIPLLTRLLRTPGAVDSTNYSVTINDLKYRWEWDPLRSDVRFRELIKDNPKN